MAKQILARLFPMLFFLSAPVFGQPNYSLEISSGYSFNISGNLLENWGDGLGLGLGVSYNISNRIQLVTSFFYQRLSYRGGHVGIFILDVSGDRPSIEGEATNIYEFVLLTRVKGRRQILSPFLILGGGIQIVDTGQILIDRTYTYRESGQSTQEAMATLGLGFCMPLRSSTSLIAEIRIIGSSNNNGFLSLVSSVQFAL